MQRSLGSRRIALSSGTIGRRLRPGLPVAAVFTVTVLLRAYHVGRAYDVFLDETIYSRIGAGVAADGRVIFGAYQFYLHGPLDFYLQAAVLRLTGVHGTAIQVLHAIRLLNVAIAGGVAALLYSLVRCHSSYRWGLLAAALFALDPFIIRFDSRVFLETFAMFWVVLGYLVLLGGSDSSRADPGAVLASRRRALLAGVAFGLALLTKETSEGLYFVPLLWCVLRGRPLSRSSALTTLATLLVTYSPYPIVAAVTGGWHEFVKQKFDGVLRLVGAVQVTGFNKAGAPSFISRLTADLGTFAMTYVVIGVGFFCAIWLYRRGTSKQRLVALWAGGAFVMLGYQTVGGTLEEQMFYYLVVPCICVVTVTAATVGRPLFASRLLRYPALVALIVIGAFDATVWGVVHSRDDTAFVRTVAWIDAHVPRNSRLAPLADGLQFILPGYVLTHDPGGGAPATPGSLRAARTQFVVTSSLQTAQGYGGATRGLLVWLDRRSIRRFSAEGQSNGTVVVWQLSRKVSRLPPPGMQTLDPRAPLSVGGPVYR